MGCLYRAAKSCTLGERDFYELDSCPLIISPCVNQNEYVSGQGIMPHKDGPLYHPRVAILSLNSTASLEFWKTLPSSTNPSPPIASVLCEPRSLLIFENEAYTSMYHGILERSHDRVTQADNVGYLNESIRGQEGPIPRGTRLSLTVRRVLAVKQSELVMTASAMEDEERKAERFARSISEKS